MHYVILSSSKRFQAVCMYALRNMLSSEQITITRANTTRKKKKERKLHNAFGLENFLKNIRYAKGTARRAFSYWLVSKSLESTFNNIYNGLQKGPSFKTMIQFLYFALRKWPKYEQKLIIKSKSIFCVLGSAKVLQCQNPYPMKQGLLFPTSLSSKRIKELNTAPQSLWTAEPGSMASKQAGHHTTASLSGGAQAQHTS